MAENNLKKAKEEDPGWQISECLEWDKCLPRKRMGTEQGERVSRENYYYNNYY